MGSELDCKSSVIRLRGSIPRKAHMVSVVDTGKHVGLWNRRIQFDSGQTPKAPLRKRLP